MKLRARVWLVTLIAGATLAVPASAAQASFGIESFFAANCNATHEACKKAPPAEEVKKSHEEGYATAGGHPPFGITDFKVNTKKVGVAEVPEGVVNHIRTDVAPGVSTNPEAVHKCSLHEFGDEELVKGSGAFAAPTCSAETIIGVNKVVVAVEPAPGVFANVPLEGTIYNLEQPFGLSSDFGVAVSLAPLGKAGVFAHTLIEGHVEWATDYHDYFEVNVSPALPLVSSRLIFKGNIGNLGKGAFLTNPTSCTGRGPQTTSKLTLKSVEGATAEQAYETPIGTEECPEVPFAPSFALSPENTQSGLPDGITTELSLPHAPKPNELDSSQLKTASITLPEGMTMNESAARAVTEACTPAQARIHSLTPGVACPAASKLGTVALEVPGLPPGSLTGNIYLGGPESGPITTPPYTVYLDAESARYGISVRLKGSIVPNETTGRLTTVFSENPEQPFSSAILHFNTGPLAPLANPLECGTATTETTLTPFTGTAAQSPFVNPFVVDANGKGGACPSSLPFSLTQSTENQSPNGGSHTNFTFNLTRPEGNQYLSQVKTTLPAGLDGAISSATQCPEPLAGEGNCPATSRLGTATIEAGAGPAPFVFSGPVYLTGPYHGAPFGLSIAVPAVAGPFNLGTVVTRATINVDPYTARVTVEATLPRIVKAVGRPSSGVLLRLRKITTTVNKQGFLSNPTNCAPLATESTLTGYVQPQSGPTGTEQLSTPFQVANCNKLAFKPSFKATTSAKTSKANGASLETTINQGSGQANIRSVRVQLPKQLPSRLTTLQKACPEAVFAADPFKCPSGSFVGGARANTPLLPDKLKGPAILVSHAAAAFPDLDLVLEGDGVRTILVGNTNIKSGITTTTFATTPDVPVSSITVNLPTGSHSALAGFGNLCANPLLMPTTITGWNGKVVKQSTKLAVGGCPVRIVGHKVVGNTAFLTVQTPAAGRISGSGSGLATVSRRLNSATKAATLKVPLSRAGRQRQRPFRVRVRVGFVPKQKGPHSVTSVTLTFF